MERLGTVSEEVERIGIVLVHGMGEQRRFEHLSSEVRDLLAALDADPNVLHTVDTRSTRDSAVGAEQQSWRAEKGAPVRVDIRYVSGEHEEKRQTLEFHEVWWADLDDKATLWNQVKFWFWGLGMWRAKRFCRPYLPGAAGMSPPGATAGGKAALWERVARAAVVRARLFGAAVVFLLTAITLDLLKAVLRWLRLGRLGSGTLYRYLGDVKLYQDRGRPGKGPLEDHGLPRRVAIRRRMVTTLVTVAGWKYDRWYVLAHSLGSVVAFNGLMETAHALPNYLSETALKGAVCFRGLDSATASDALKRMSPRRPVWVRDGCTLDRKKLFSRLRGFVTYGSPLDKFAFLWPQIVNVNKDKSAFAEGLKESFEWINIFDHTDPVAGHLDAFRDACGEGRGPRNFAYKACWALLYSHKRYLKGGAKSDSASRKLLDWILDGKSDFKIQQQQCGRGRRWYARKHPLFGIVLRMTMWLPLTVALAVAVGFLSERLLALADGLLPDWLLAPAVDFLQDLLPSACDSSAIPCIAGALGTLGAIVLGTAGAIVLIAGLLRYLIEALIDRRRHRSSSPCDARPPCVQKNGAGATTTPAG